MLVQMVEHYKCTGYGTCIYRIFQRCDLYIHVHVLLKRERGHCGYFAQGHAHVGTCSSVFVQYSGKFRLYILTCNTCSITCQYLYLLCVCVCTHHNFIRMCVLCV